jgi:hypothetical protein
MHFDVNLIYTWFYCMPDYKKKTVEYLIYIKNKKTE